MAKAMSCWEAEGKAWILGSTGTEGFLGQRQEAKIHQEQALVFDSRRLGGAELIAWTLASSTGLPKGLVHMTKICNPILPEFVTDKLVCFTKGKQSLQPFPREGHTCTFLP